MEETKLRLWVEKTNFAKVCSCRPILHGGWPSSFHAPGSSSLVSQTLGLPGSEGHHSTQRCPSFSSLPWAFQDASPPWQCSVQPVTGSAGCTALYVFNLEHMEHTSACHNSW